MTRSDFPDCAVHVAYCLTATLSDDDVRAARAQVSVEERDRGARLQFDRDRREFFLAHALSRRVLSAHGDRAPDAWPFTTDRHGKPILTPQDARRTGLVFNLSHTSGLVACAVGRDVEVGIDVERVDRGVDAIALSERFFSSAEASALRQLARPARATRFTEMWTLKEAFIKAVGEGLSFPLDAFTFTFADDGSLSFACTRPTRARSWLFALHAPSPEHRMAVAIGTDAANPPALRVEPAHGPIRTVLAKGGDC